MERAQEKSVLSRRRFMAGTVALGTTATAATAAANAPDPIFVLIEREREAMDAFERAFADRDRAQEALWALKRENKGASEAVLVLKRTVEELEERQREALDRADDALLEVTAATPTTAAGLFAVMDLFWRRGRDLFDESTEANLHGLFAAVRAIVGRPA